MNDTAKHSLDILKHFVFNKINFEITILYKNGEPLFKAADIAQVLGLKNISAAIGHFDEDEKGIITNETLGGPQKCLFLTDIGLYRLLFRSHKEIAKPFQKWIAKIIREIQRNGGLNGQDLITMLENAERKEVESNDLIRHNTFLTAFHKKPVLYFAKIGERDGKLLIKIGATKDIRETFLERHPRDYENIRAVHVIECEKHFDFEYFLIHHKRIKPFLYKKPVKKNGGCSIETILVSEDELQSVFRIVQTHRRNYPVSTHSQISNLEDQIIELRRLMVHSFRSITNDSQKYEDNVYENDEDSDDSVKDSEYVLSQMPSPIVIKNVQKKNRNRKLGTGKCSDCDTDITDRATKCSKCFKPDKKFVISKDELHDLVWVQKLPYTKIGERFGVSDNAIRKRSKVLGVELRKVKNVRKI